MYSDKRHRYWFLWIMMLLMVLVVFSWHFLDVFGRKNLQEEGAVALQASIEQCALQCYVVEGGYPPNLSYLEEYYGLQINRDSYYVVYNALASNIPPDVQVLYKE